MASNTVPEHIKVVIVGSNYVGKSCLFITYTTNSYPNYEYIPTIFDNYVARVMLNNKYVELNLWDTGGADDYDRLRPRSYPDTDVVLIAYSIGSRESFDSVKDKWVPEVRHYCPTTPFILIGTKSDLRSIPKSKTVKAVEGFALAKSTGAFGYLECSAKNGYGLQDVLDEAVKAVQIPR